MVVVTDHTPVDYAMVAEQAKVVVDSRGVLRNIAAANIISLGGRRIA